MHLLQHLNQKRRRGLIVGVAIMLGASNAMAAGHAGHGAGHGAGGARHSGAGAPILDSTPLVAPTFNPSYPSTLPEAPEVPVSPASPGSIFGND